MFTLNSLLEIVTSYGTISNVDNEADLSESLQRFLLYCQLFKGISRDFWIIDSFGSELINRGSYTRGHFI